MDGGLRSGIGSVRTARDGGETPNGGSGIPEPPIHAHAIPFGNFSGSGVLTDDVAHLVYDNTFAARVGLGTTSPFNGLFGPGSLGVGMDIYSSAPGQLTALSLQGSIGGASSSGVQIAMMAGIRGSGVRPEWQCAAIVADDAAVNAFEGHLDIYCNKNGTVGTFSTNGQQLVAEFYSGVANPSGCFVVTGGIAIGNGVHSGSNRGLYPIDSGIGFILQRDDASVVGPTGAGIPNCAKLRYIHDTGVPKLQVSFDGGAFQTVQVV